MNLVHPYILLALLIPFGVFALLVLTNKETAARIFDPAVLRRLRIDGDVLPLRVRNGLLLGSILLMILAAGRPVIEQGERTVSLRGLSAMIALDISGSMRSQDLYPDRLTFAKRKIAQLMQAMPADELALSAFAHSAFMLAPFTTDKATLTQILEGVDESYINLASTDFRAVGELSATFLKQKHPRILIVFSDGGDADALTGFASTLQEANITLYTVLVGTQKGAPVLDQTHRPVHTADGNIAITQRNDAIGAIAKATGGESIIAHNGKNDMEQLAQSIHRRFDSQEQGNITIKERIELFVYLLGGATALLLLGLISLPKRSMRPQYRSRT